MSKTLIQLTDESINPTTPYDHIVILSPGVAKLSLAIAALLGGIVETPAMSPSTTSTNVNTTIDEIFTGIEESL